VSPPTRPNGVSKASSVDPSPCPQTSRSPPVGISLRCLPISAPSGPKYSCVLYSVLPVASRSFTPTDT
jgi:hypothetical protein